MTTVPILGAIAPMVCAACEVGWHGRPGELCWCCGLPGIRGVVAVGLRPGIVPGER